MLDRLGLEPETVFLVEAANDGSIILRPAGIYPLEIYTDARVNDFLAEDELSDEERQRLAGARTSGRSSRRVSYPEGGAV